MHIDDQTQDVDLRMLKLLHAMRDVEGFVLEARRLKETQRVDDAAWQHICELGRELDILVHTPDYQAERDTNLGHNFDRRKKNRRCQVRRAGNDRRRQDRRTTVVLWLGPERRLHQRRQHARRQIECPEGVGGT